ncbi:MAG TPA: hypothetical protein VFY71_11175 [Planctomycetota bacterium]|nr:hypothetical protein [Planctomycetota bacterium]
MKHFVVVYDRPSTSLLLFRQFAEGDWPSANTLRNDLELKYRLQPEIEIVLLGSDSIATLKATHSRYFVHVVDPDAPKSLSVVA